MPRSARPLLPGGWSGFSIGSLYLIGAIGLAACSGDGPAADATTPPSGTGFGLACQEDGECSSGLCVDRVCSKLCTKQSDCPMVAGEPFDCGEVTEKKKVACYPRRAPTVPFTVGHNCSTDSKCALGFTCLGQLGTADRYCSKTCESDRDCPPRFRCTRTRIGLQEPEPESWCRRRELCHPCVIDDQCGTPPENLCVEDPAGNGFCSKACDPKGTGCPTWAKCSDVGNHQLQCTPKRSYCYKPAGGGQCDACLHHGWETVNKSDYTINEVGTCQSGGACYLLSTFTRETICVMPCAPDGSCPAGGSLTYSCYELKSLAGKYCIPTVMDPVSGAKTFGSCANP